MHFHVAAAARKTGVLLHSLIETRLEEEGLKPGQNLHICYGQGYTGEEKGLNKNCSRYNKRQQADILRTRLGSEALQVFANPEEAEEFLRRQGSPLLLARTEQHSKGRDIKVAAEDWQIRPFMASGSDFFTVYEPSVREFRTWVYRKRHLGTYEKILRRPEDYKRIGRNHANGFDFSGIESENVSEDLKRVARAAIAALDLDFGAVDILQRADGTYCVLEVNSAPGVSDERRKVINGLAKRIVRWVANGCPDRN